MHGCHDVHIVQMEQLRSVIKWLNKKKGRERMSRRILTALLPMLIGVALLSGCGTMGDGIPPEKLGEYAQVVSRVGERGSNMDTLPKRRIGFESVAYISWI